MKQNKTWPGGKPYQ